MSFGGPAAHIGYFRQTFVNEPGWLDDKRYASLVAFKPIYGARVEPSGLCHWLSKRWTGGALMLPLLVLRHLPFILMYLLAVTTSAWLLIIMFKG